MSEDPWETWEAQFEQERRPRRRPLRPTDYLMMAGVALLFLMGSIIVLGGALVIEPAQTQIASEWRLEGSAGACRAGDLTGYEYGARLTNTSEQAREFRVAVVFEVDGRRVASGQQRIASLPPEQTAIIRVVAPTTFPQGLPDVRCRAEVRHSARG